MIWVILYLYSLGVVALYISCMEQGLGMVRSIFISFLWPVTIFMFLLLLFYYEVVRGGSYD